MFDGMFLNKIIDEISFLKTGRINKITESGDTDFIFTIRYQRQNYNLMISSSTQYFRIHLTKKNYDSVLKPKSFTLFLRKHIEGYIIENIETYKSDRVVIFTLKGLNELEDLNTKYLICELMGRYSNIILTDSNYVIIDSIKHDGVGEFNRTIMPNVKYEFLENNKIDPKNLTKDEIENIFIKNNIDNPKKLLETFNGVSKLLAIKSFINDNAYSNFYDYINNDISPSIIKIDNKEDFYFIPFDYEIIKKYKTISELLDDFYYDIDLKSKIKLKTNDLESFINKELKKYQKKLIKLNDDLNNTNDIDKFKLYGELLLSSPNLKDKKKHIIVFNYYDNKEIEIPLDEKYSIIDNSNKYYKKYQKAKASINYIKEQINITNNEIEYFKLLKYQIENSTINEALEIERELINNKYLFKKNYKETKKQKPKLLTYIFNDSLFYVGKNNIQNDYLTNHFSKPNDLWFHIKNAPGSHVVLHKDNNINDDDIRMGAYLASYYSSFSDSSSVPVDYTFIKYVKKIPGKKGCFVSYTHEKTLYIDPDKNIIDKLEVKK